MTVCAACGASESDGARFCSRCGAELASPRTCASCGELLAPDARFCPACGHAAPVPADESARERRGVERKIATVVFADVTGSTELGERLDPEHFQEVMRTYFRAMQEEIEAEGGTVEKFIGDAVMAAFGVPIAHEDDAARALRAAIRMRRRLASVNEGLMARFGLTLAVRIGVNTGPVVATAEIRDDLGMVSGDMVNAAARLQQSARPDQILVGERTARSVRGFALREVGPLTVKGKSVALRAVELLDEGGDVERPVQQARGVPGRRVAMVGRGDEMRLLRSVFARLAPGGRAQLVTVYGEPGVGKSRLSGEFLEWASEQAPSPTVVKGRCLPYGDGVAYWPLAEILQSLTGVRDNDPPPEALAKIAQLIEGPLEGADDPARAAAALAFTLGLEDPRFALSDLSPRHAALEMHTAWRALFAGMSRNAPMVVLVEDIHWADPSLLDLLDELADRTAGQVMFVCPARPELLQSRPTWGGGRRTFTAIALEPLSPQASAQLVDELLAIGGLPAEARDRILARAEGNPFFLEEIVRQLIDEGRIVRDGDGWRIPTTGLAEFETPDTVQGVLAARIDLLDPPAKRALRWASVVGRQFWVEPVARLQGVDAEELDGVLATLEDRDLVRSRAGSAMAGQREFAFKHILTRDVAYATLPRRDRARAHAEVADWIEEKAGPRRAAFADLIAHHRRDAFEALSAEPDGTPEAVEEARRGAFDAEIAASADARSKMLLPHADALANRALAIAVGPRERAAALEALGMNALWDFRGDEAWSNLREAVDTLVEAGEGEPEAIALMCARAIESPTRWIAAMLAQPTEDEVAPYVRIGLDRASEGGEAWIRLRTAEAFWAWAFPNPATEERREASRAAGEIAVAAAMAIGRLDLASAALDAIGAIDFSRGHHGRAWGSIERRLEIVSRMTDPWEVGDILQMAGDEGLLIGRYREALRRSTEGYERSRAGPIVWAPCLAWMGQAKFHLGDWDGALEAHATLEESIPLARYGQTPYALTVARCVAAMVHDLRGDAAAADALIALVEQGGEHGTARRLPWLARLAARRGDRERAFQLVEGAEGRRDQWKGAMLEARCDVAAEVGAWEIAAQVADDAEAWGLEDRLDALPLHAQRLRGRAAMRGDRLEAAVASLTAARDGFAGLGAVWDEALASLWLAEALAATGGHDREAATLATAARETFERLGSTRELQEARSLLERLSA